MANRDIADHMDRLPRDIAAERLHHDIVRLLDEHVPRPSAVQSMHQSTNNISNMQNSNSSPAHVMNDTFTLGAQNQGPPQPKPKKRTVKQEKALQDGNEMAPKPPRRPSNRKKKSADSLLNGGAINHAMDSSPLSTESSTMSPPDVHSMHNNMYNVPANSMAISQPNLSSLAEPHNAHSYGTLQISKPPPPYDDTCFNSKAVSFHNLHFTNYSTMANSSNGNVLNGSQQQQQQANQQQQYLQHNSPFPSPQSVASQFTAQSPTMSYTGSPPQPQATSPNKRPSLPTSPTHIAALRAATQQNLQQKLMSSSTNAFEFTSNSGGVMAVGGPNNNQFYNGGGGSMSHYPTPPSQHSEGNTPPQHLMHGPDSYPTPSPESPGQWSSSSPHSTSDWSEGISSPPGATQIMYNAHPQIQMQLQHNSSRGPEGIYI
jgi:Notch-like protein